MTNLVMGIDNEQESLMKDPAQLQSRKPFKKPLFSSIFARKQTVSGTVPFLGLFSEKRNIEAVE